MSNLDSRLEKLEALAPPRNQFIVRIIGNDESIAESIADAERQAKEQGKDLLVIHRRIVTPGNAEMMQ